MSLFSCVGNRDGWTPAPGMRNDSQVLGNIIRESDSQRLVDVRARDNVGNSVTTYLDQPCNNLLTQVQLSNTESMLVEENTDNGGLLATEHLRNPLQTQLNWQVVYPCFYTYSYKSYTWTLLVEV